jgi:CcmD family protein
MPIALLQVELPSSNLPYLFAAFAVSWAVFFLYAFFVTRRQQEMQSEIKELRRVMELRQKSGGD